MLGTWGFFNFIYFYCLYLCICLKFPITKVTKINKTHKKIGDSLPLIFTLRGKCYLGGLAKLIGKGQAVFNLN